MFRTIVAFLFVAAFMPFTAAAQLGLPGVAELTLSPTPQYPRPYETVTVKLSSNLINLPGSDIVFYVDGVVRAENEQSVSFQTGAAGVKTTVRAVVTHPDGVSEATLVLLPQDVALIVEPTSSMHPFYLGAGLPTPDSPVRIVALARVKSSGVEIAPSNLVYEWRLGDKQLTAESGIGKNVLTATGPTRYRDARIIVTVSSRDRTATGQAGIVVAPVAPQVLIYRNDPLLGIDFAHALSGSFTLPGTEEAFRAIGYYFGTTPTLSWTLNGTETATDTDLTVRTTGTERGTALIGVSATGEGIFATAENQLTVEYGQVREGLFGF